MNAAAQVIVGDRREGAAPVRLRAETRELSQVRNSLATHTLLYPTITYAAAFI